MYLNRLSSQMKFAFLELALHLSKTDGQLSYVEKDVIDDYCDEMRIDNNHYQNEMTLEEVMELVKVAPEEEQRIIYFELIYLVMADNLYHENERAFMKDFEAILGIHNSVVQEVFDMVSAYRNVISRIDNFVFEEE